MPEIPGPRSCPREDIEKQHTSIEGISEHYVFKDSMGNIFTKCKKRVIYMEIFNGDGEHIFPGMPACFLDAYNNYVSYKKYYKSS